jgi:hypothetical protein
MGGVRLFRRYHQRMTATKTKLAALNLRVRTDAQTTNNKTFTGDRCLTTRLGRNSPHVLTTLDDCCRARRHLFGAYRFCLPAETAR